MQELIEDLEDILEEDMRALNEAGKLDREYIRRLSRKDRLFLAIVSNSARVAHNNRDRMDKTEVRLDNVEGKVRWLIGGIGTVISMVLGTLIAWLAGFLPN